MRGVAKRSHIAPSLFLFFFWPLGVLPVQYGICLNHHAIFFPFNLSSVFMHVSCEADAGNALLYAVFYFRRVELKGDSVSSQRTASAGEEKQPMFHPIREFLEVCSSAIYLIPWILHANKASNCDYFRPGCSRNKITHPFQHPQHIPPRSRTAEPCLRCLHKERRGRGAGESESPRRPRCADR